MSGLCCRLELRRRCRGQAVDGNIGKPDTISRHGSVNSEGQRKYESLLGILRTLCWMAIFFRTQVFQQSDDNVFKRNKVCNSLEYHVWDICSQKTASCMLQPICDDVVS